MSYTGNMTHYGRPPSVNHRQPTAMRRSEHAASVCEGSPFHQVICRTIFWYLVSGQLPDQADGGHIVLNEPIRNIFLRTRPEAYRNYLTDAWCERIESLTSSSPHLSELVFDIVLEWRAASYAASLPALIPEHTKTYHDSFVNTGQVNTTLVRLAEGISGNLARRIPELTSDPSLIRRIQTAIVNLGSDLEAAKSDNEGEMSLDGIWNDYLKLPPFFLGLWGSQRIVYMAIYNSYENFFVQLVRTATGNQRCRAGDSDFNKLVVVAFDSGIKEKCWTDNRLSVARLARHSLSHAGGRVTEELDKIRPKHEFAVEGDRIQITPDKTKALFELLSDCVYAAAEKAVGMSQFK